jgi:hypothetical protein
MTVRTFETWATRDIDTGKLEYSDYINPLCDYSFANFMKWKQYINWTIRAWNNWQKWIPNESLLSSLVRHTEIIKLLYQGYRVFETKDRNDVIDLKVYKTDNEIEHSWYNFVEEKTIINELNAIRFNSEALKLYYIKEEMMHQIIDNVVSLNIDQD